MPGEVVFKSSEPKQESGPTNISTGPQVSTSTSEVEIPYLDYKSQKGTPHSVEFFGIGDTWSEPVGGFPEEIGVIEDYFREQVETGELANSTKAVKERLKEILKVTNMSKEERNVIRVETVAAYIKFLRSKDAIKHSVKRYG
jgi:hypothetical protein